MASYVNRTSLPPPPEIITYRLGDKLIFVKPAMEYEDAIDMAIQEFPTLKPISEGQKDRITFYTTTTVNGKRQNVCISKSAWKPCVTRMLRGEMITIVVVDPESGDANMDLAPPPPQYLEVPKQESLGSKNATGRSRKSRSSDSATRFSIGSVSSIEPIPRRPSPSRSTGGSGSSSRRRSWFGRG